MRTLDTDELLFFDCEVFHENAFVVFKDINKKLLRVFHNNFLGLEDFVKGKTLVSYNGYFYDDVIVHQMLNLATPYQLKKISNRIISGEKMKVKNYKYNSLDCFQQIDPSFPSLKRIEGNMGKAIIESSIPFDIERALTDEEYHDVLDYCKYDVDMLVEVYKMRVNSYFKPKETLLEMLGSDKGKRWNTTTLSANVLLDKPLTKWSNIRVPEWMLDLVPPEVVELWTTKAKGKVTVKEFDCDIEFGFGGLHGTHNRVKKVENMKLLDVTSMYPNIILNIKALGISTDKYKSLLDERIQIKHKDKTRSDALKLILNSVYGNLKNQYSMLNNPKAALSVCVYGQIALYELCRRLAPIATIVNINTDGVGFEAHDDRYIDIWHQWEKDFNLTLEEDNHDLFIQRDVNNYIGKESDNITCKGGDVAKYSRDSLFRNNNARILDIAMVNKLVYKKDILDTLMSNLDKPYLYQYILQAGGTYAGSFDQDDAKHEKVNRVFASKDKGFCLYKKRHDGGLVKFADAPENMHLWNGECDDIEDFQTIVDLNHYYQIITKRLEKWV